MNRNSDADGLQRILRLPEVLKFTGWCRSTLYERIREGKVPPGTKLDPDGRSVGWFEYQVLAHQRALRDQIAGD
jgi:predicted DNA-binding transcriptional regulator AlpA